MSIWSCETEQKSEGLLARAYGEELSIEDVQEAVDLGQANSDSIVILKKYIDNWVMDKILQKKAKDVIGKDEKIENLVDTYRRQLYANALTERMVSDIDTKGGELANSDSISVNNLLNEDLIQFIMVKVPVNHNNDTLKTLWKTEDLNGLEVYCNYVGGQSVLDINKWYYKGQLQNITPVSLYKKINFSRQESYSYSDSTHKFYFKLLDRKKKGESAPKAYIKQKKMQLIERDERKKNVEEWKRTLYRNEIQKKEIAVYDNF